jgi:hypothetical protein
MELFEESHEQDGEIALFRITQIHGIAGQEFPGIVITGGSAGSFRGEGNWASFGTW